MVREFGMDTSTRPYSEWITGKGLRCSTGNSPQRYAAAWMGGELGGWIRVRLSHSAMHLK